MTSLQTSLSASEQLTVDNYPIEVRRAGRRGAQMIVLVHGIGVSSRYFLPLAEELARDYDVAVLDLPGYGRAPDPKHTLSIAELGRVVAAYVRQEAGMSAVLVGHSMGCQIVAHTAQQSPELCKRLILLGPTVNKWERSRRMQAWRLVQDIVREPLRVSLLVFGDYLRMGIGRYLRTLRSMIDDRIEETLAGSNTPTLIIRGENDPIVPAIWVGYLATQVKHARVDEILGAPHVIQFKKAQKLAKVVRGFLSSSNL